MKQLLGLLGLLIGSAVAQLPYNPTRILLSPLREDLIYLFQASSTSNGGFELGSINLSSVTGSSDLPYTTLESSLPFLQDESNTAFIPVIDNDGNITVYSGKCSAGTEDASLWKYIPDGDSKSGQGEWVQQTVTSTASQNSVAAGANFGANFLASGVSFSSIVGQNVASGLYIFGGMCPSENATQETWQAAANYSDSMISLTPTSSQASNNFTIGNVSSRGPPVPEAGYALCSLSPTFSNDTDGVQEQQQNFVLVGGHTENAFINTSTVALFSLPQASWTFLPVDQPSSQHTDLAVRTDITEVEPRSGHTAVLSSDGQMIVVFGGWVGDVNTPANPQLAILNVGNGYGGQGTWSWVAPSASGVAPSFDGIYGHGAAMLPGNVLMISGGYTITSTSSKHKQRSSQTQGTQRYFYNLTANSWISSYNLPETNSSTQRQSDSGPLSKSSEKAGLGAGLGIGCALILGLALFLFWYIRNRRKLREQREKELSRLAFGVHRNASGSVGNLGDVMYEESGGRYPEMYSRASEKGTWPWDREGGPSGGWKRAHGREAERTGLLLEIPSPTRGLRRSLSARVQPHMIARYDDGQTSRATGGIHPIDEREEDEGGYGTPSPHADNVADSPTKETQLYLSGKPGSSSGHPALDREIMGSGSRSPLPSAARKSVLHNNSWMDDLEKEIVIGTMSSSSSSAGRASPTKSDRTGSNLSDRSARSVHTLSSYRSNALGHMARSRSIRSAGLQSGVVDPFLTPEGSPTREQRPDLGRSHSERSSTSYPARPDTGTGSEGKAESFTTAKSSFARLQAEGEALLGGRPDTGSSDRRHNGEDNDSPADHGDPEPNTAREPTRSWIGTVKRAIGRARAGRPVSEERNLSSAGMRHTGRALLSPQIDSDAIESGPSSNSERRRPTRSSADSSLWPSTQRGARDWGVGEVEGVVDGKWRRNSGDDWGSPEDRDRKMQREAEAGEEWDVEKAAEGRDVQIVFTVPKQRLRIVNTEPEVTSLMSAASDEDDTIIGPTKEEDNGEKGKGRAETL